MGFSILFKNKPVLDIKEISFKNQIEDVIPELYPNLKDIYIQNKATKILGDVSVKLKDFKQSKPYQILQNLLTTTFVKNEFWLTYEDVVNVFNDLDIFDRLTPSAELVNGIDYLKIGIIVDIIPLLKMMDNIRKLDDCLPYQNFNEVLFDKIVKPEFVNCFKLSPREAGVSVAKGVALPLGYNTPIENPWFNDNKGNSIKVYDDFKNLMKNNQTLDAKTALCSIMSLSKSFCPSRERLNMCLKGLQSAVDNYKVCLIPQETRKTVKKARKILRPSF